MFRAIKYSLSLLAALTANFSFGAWSDLNMSPGATQLSQEIFGLHMTVFYVCLAIGIAVLLAMAFILFKYNCSAFFTSFSAFATLISSGTR